MSLKLDQVRCSAAQTTKDVIQGVIRLCARNSPRITIRGGPLTEHRNIMTVLYKYMPFISNFLDNPTIKLSPPALLNDPFEAQNAQDISDFIYSMYRDEYDGSIVNGRRISPSRAKTIITKAPLKTINQSGVFSLSESNRSLLMWAHYADQHKGIVLGIEDDFLEEDYYTKIPARLIYTEKPVKVNYDTIRFDPSEYSLSKKHISHATRLLAMKMLTTKSDDWLYEKEHRVILPIAMADEIKYKGRISDLGYFLKKSRDNEEFSINIRTRKVSISEDIDMTHSVYRYMSSNKNFLFLKKLNPQKIKSIYFGVRAEYEEIKEYLDAIHDNKDVLGHIKLYKYDLCDKRFSLLKTEVDPEEYTDDFYL